MLCFKMSYKEIKREGAIDITNMTPEEFKELKSGQHITVICKAKTSYETTAILFEMNNMYYKCLHNEALINVIY